MDFKAFSPRINVRLGLDEPPVVQRICLPVYEWRW